MSLNVRQKRADAIDVALLTAMIHRPDSTVVALAASTGLSRNTVRARLTRYEHDGVLESLERRVRPAFLGYPLKAYILTNVTQRKLTEVSQALERIPEIVEVNGLSGAADLLIMVVAVDADDLYRIAGQILLIDGVKRTKTALAMRQLVRYRMSPLLNRLARNTSGRPDSI